MANEFDLFTSAPTGASVSPVQDEFSSFVASTTAQAPAPMAEKPPVDFNTPAFIAPRQRATKLVERAATIKEEEDMLNEKPKEEVQAKAFGGFAERRSK